MPKIPMTESEARDIAAYLLFAEVSKPEEPAKIGKLPKVERPVSFAEVTTRVFGHSCGHCHQDPNMMGLGGPGSTGGFGFPARGIQLSSWDGTRVGYLDLTTGQRGSFFNPKAQLHVVGHTETRSLLVASLLARHEEVRGRPIPGLRGMPMGLPPLPLEDIALVEAWVNQGGPR